MRWRGGGGDRHRALGYHEVLGIAVGDSEASAADQPILSVG